jgi:2'-hydroxyisoflavone reductase
MRILILGGTVFLGRAIACHARDAGHDVTCLARGDSGSPVDGVRFLTGDRNQPEAFAGLAGEEFDLVVGAGAPPPAPPPAPGRPPPPPPPAEL